MKNPRFRSLDYLIPSESTQDGGGVKLRRSLGRYQRFRVDPFLMLDEFSSDRPEDYLAGFPSHPHRGFETVTYMLEGHMLHEDHLGNRGHLVSGGAQWMTAGRGVIHSEMPQQEQGRLRGFQLWINLPAAEKMKPAAYSDIPPEQIPEVTLEKLGRVRVIAGRFRQGESAVSGPVFGLSTEPLFFDVRLETGGCFRTELPIDHSAFLYPYEGSLQLGESILLPQSAAVLSVGDQLEVSALKGPARFLLLAGRPIREPVVQYGPFVMNTREEIEQAVEDYQNGRLCR